MRRVIFTLAVAGTLGVLAMPSVSQAQHCHGGPVYVRPVHHHPIHVHHPVFRPVCHEPVRPIGPPISCRVPFGYNSWTQQCWFNQYNCRGYYCPQRQSWYYFYQPMNCYLPVQYMNQYAPTPVGPNGPGGPGNGPQLPPGAEPLPGGEVVGQPGGVDPNQPGLPGGVVPGQPGLPGGVVPGQPGGVDPIQPGLPGGVFPGQQAGQPGNSGDKDQVPPGVPGGQAPGQSGPLGQLIGFHE